MNTKMGLSFPQIVTKKLKRKIQRQIKTFLVFGLIFTTAFNGLIIPPNFADAAMAPGGAVGPVSASTGFPAWYKDQQGLALDLMEAADTFGISAPVEAGNAFSNQIGFGGEGFWWSADSLIDNGTIKARLVLGLEAAFSGGAVNDGDQSAFGRVRFVIDGLTPNASYTIKYPYGTVTEVADNFGSIFVTDDIGCFAAAGASSCNPNHPLGSPLPQFNFGAALSSQIGPFLTWDTFNIDPLLTDAALVNPDPAYASRQYVGNPAIDHAVTGSPINQNFFRIEGPTDANMPAGFIESNLFTVTGRLAESAAPVIDVIPNKTTAINAPITFQANATDVNLDVITYSVTPVTASGNEAAATINSVTGEFSWTPDTAGTATFTVGASDGTTISTTSVTIEVTAVAPVPVSIAVTPNTASVVTGAARQFSAVALDLNGAQIIPTPTMTWSSSDAAKATVDSVTGLVTAVATGTATITATDGTVSGSAAITVTPLVLVGGGLSASIPVEPVSKFPKWYKDRTGLALELMDAADTFGISAPVVGVGTFSETIGFGAEGFWSSADATMQTSGSKPAVLVQAVEAAFAGEVAVDGQQSAFGRIRIRVDVNQPGTYVVTYPYGQRTYTVDTVGAGYEINDTSDIGCFAIQGVSSCDPANPLGSTQAAFNFNGVGLSEVGPFLSWDTFNPINNDPALINPNPLYANRKYVGNVAIAHAIKGSPTGNNFFRIESATPGVDLDPAAGTQSFIETNLFNVSGRLADVTAPVITVLGVNPDSVLQNAVYTDPGATALDDFDGNITAKITATPVNTAIAGPQTITYTVADVAGNVATATRIVNVLELPAVTDVVSIVAAAPTIVTGATQQLSIAIVDVNGVAVTPAPAITLVSADPAIATVDANGLVTAVTAGTTTITATALGLPAATTTITVTDPLPVPVVDAINVVAAAPTIVTGAIQQLSVAVLDQNGVIITPAPSVIITAVDPAVATVDPAGVVTGVANGVTAITATVDGTVIGTTNITVTDPTPTPAVTALNIVNAAPTVITGTTQQLSIAAVDQAGVIITPAPAIVVTSADPLIATVDALGTIEAVAPGTTTITATTPGATDAVITITVVEPTTPVVTAVNVTTAVSNIPAGTTQQLSVAVLDQNGTAIVTPPAISLVSDTPAVATVDAGTGLVTAVATGTAIITLTSDGQTDTQTINVTPAPVPESSIIKSGELTFGKASFIWRSKNGIGSQNGTVSGSYTYYTDGSYLRFQVKDVNGQVVKFADVFETGAAVNDTVGGMTLQTNGAAINDMDGSSRERTDWGVVPSPANPTNLPNVGNYVYYGVIQNVAVGTKTVGFAAGDTRTVNMTLSPKVGLIPGVYAVLVDVMQQGSEVAMGSISYTFEVVDMTAYNAALSATVQADYTPASWSAYQAVVMANVMTTANTQAEIDAATLAITTAQGNLVTLVAQEAINQAAAETAVSAYEAGPISTLAEIAIAEGLKDAADTAVLAVGDVTAKTAFDLRVSAREAAIASARAVLEAAALEATAQAAADAAVVAYESGPITTLAEVTIAEGLKAAADTAVSAVGDATVKSAFEQRVATRAIEIGTAKTSLEAAAAAEAAAAQAAAAEAAAQASAETAVAAYEAGPLTSLAEVASAEGLKASADTAVSAVGNAAAKSAFELRISIRSAAIVTAKMALITASGSNSGTSGGVSGGSVPVWMLQQTNPTTVPQGSAVETPVQNVEDEEEGLDNSGKNLTEVQTPIQKVLGVKVYPEGSLIRTVDKKIYVIKNGMNVLIKNLIELKQYAGQKIIDIKDAISGLQAYSEGSLVRTPDKKIYVIKNGEKVLIKNLIELRQYAGMKITDISGLQAYSEGSLVRTPDKKIYVIKNGEKVLIKNLIELRQYAGMKIVDVPMAQ